MITKLKRVLRSLLLSGERIAELTHATARLGERMAELAYAAARLDQLASQSEIRALIREIGAKTPGNPCLFGAKVYSQFDEDGIIEHVFSLIGSGETFLEVGCGNGLENNTHLLLLKGWRGMWVDASEANIAAIRANVPDSPRLHVARLFVTTETATDLAKVFSSAFPRLDFLSVDIDGNDLPVLQRLLELRPLAICVEYNAKFPPPLAVGIKYDPAHEWASDEYHGASLQALVDGLPGYRLVSCNVVGSNAFFVREDHAGKFPAYDTAQLYQPPRFYLLPFPVGHAPSYRFLRNSIDLEAHGR